MKTSSIFLAVMTLFMTSCANVAFGNKTVEATGPELTGSVKAQSITKIEANQAIVVNYKVGPSVSVDYSVPQSLSEYLQITCKDGKLKCKYKDGINARLGDRKVVVNVVAPGVCDYEASSAALINVSGCLNVPKLEVEASSAAKVVFDDVQTSNAELDANSAASISVKSLNTMSVDADASSSANIGISGDLGNVNVDVSSAATVTISGACKHLNADASSAGAVKALKAKIASGNLEASSGASITVTEALSSPYKMSKSSGGSINIR